MGFDRNYILNAESLHWWASWCDMNFLMALGIAVTPAQQARGQQLILYCILHG